MWLAAGLMAAGCTNFDFRDRKPLPKAEEIRVTRRMTEQVAFVRGKAEVAKVVRMMGMKEGTISPSAGPGYTLEFLSKSGETLETVDVWVYGPMAAWSRRPATFGGLHAVSDKMRKYLEGLSPEDKATENK